MAWNNNKKEHLSRVIIHMTKNSDLNQEPETAAEKSV